MALRDAIKAHRSLYLDGNILHRDISENNIIITDPEKADGHSGMLIDLDLAKEVGSGRSGARHQTGTMEFMAIEVLLNIDHTYRHDLESFLYVLIWQCARHGWGKNNHPKDSKLRAWYTGNYEDIANAKLGHMSKAENMGFGFILREFPPKFRGVLPLCGALRDILFPYNDKGLIVGTPQDPNRLYDPIIKAYDDTIAQFELENLTSDKSTSQQAEAEENEPEQGDEERLRQKEHDRRQSLRARLEHYREEQERLDEEWEQERLEQELNITQHSESQYSQLADTRPESEGHPPAKDPSYPSKRPVTQFDFDNVASMPGTGVDDQNDRSSDTLPPSDRAIVEAEMPLPLESVKISFWPWERGQWRKTDSLEVDPLDQSPGTSRNKVHMEEVFLAGQQLWTEITEYSCSPRRKKGS